MALYAGAERRTSSIRNPIISIFTLTLSLTHICLVYFPVITLNIFSSVCRCQQQAISTHANDVQLEGKISVALHTKSSLLPPGERESFESINIHQNLLIPFQISSNTQILCMPDQRSPNIYSPRAELHLENEFVSDKHHHHRRARRNVFYDMIQDFTGMNDDEEEDEDDESDEEGGGGGGGGGYSSATTESSAESSTTRFGRFMSPLAFSKISETLGEFVHSFALRTSFIFPMTREICLSSGESETKKKFR